MYTEGIALEQFSALPKADINSNTPPRQRLAVFHYFNLIIANNIMPILLHKTSVLLHCLKTKKIDVIIKYNMGKH